MKNTADPLVSVIVPVYKGEKYVDTVIKAIQKQMYKNWELIIVIDGSPDKSLCIAKEYAENDGRIMVLEKDNGGICSARNFGLKYAKGEYIAFSDQDDYPLPNMLKDLVNGINDADMVVAGQNLQYIKDKDVVGEKKYQYEDSVLRSRKEILGFIFNIENDAASQHIWNCLYKRSIIIDNNIYFDEYFRHGLEDFKFNMVYANRCKCIVKISTIVYEYRSRVGISTSTKSNDQAIKEFIYLLDEVKKEFFPMEDKYAYQIRCLFALRGLFSVYLHGNYAYSKRRAMDEIRSYYKQQYCRPISIIEMKGLYGVHNSLYYILDKIIRSNILYKILLLFSMWQ